jgi:hypothetical protein
VEICKINAAKNIEKITPTLPLPRQGGGNLLLISKDLPSPPRGERRCEKIDLVLFYVIPAKAGIQCFHILSNSLDPGFHRGDG